MSTEQQAPTPPPARTADGRRIGAWVIGRNIAGYLPESDTVGYIEWLDAWIALWDMAREYADEDDELWESICAIDADGHEHGDYRLGTMRATVDSMSTDAALDPTAEGSEWGMIVNDYNDRPISFWLMRDDERVADDAEDEYDPTAITSVWSSHGHEFLSTGEYEEHDGRTLGIYYSCLTCGAEYVLRATPDAFSDGAYQTSGGDEPAECTGDTSMAHGCPGVRECFACPMDENTSCEHCAHACPCIRCTG